MNILIELHYLPSVPYFSALCAAEKIVIEKHEYFEKQTYRNRCYIHTAQGVERLILPLTSKHGKVLITEVRMDYSQKWLNNHWRTIESAYRSSPFFEYYADDLHKILFRQQTFLYDLNFEILTICLKWLKMDVTLQESMSYEKIPAEGTLDLRNIIHAKKPELSAPYFQAVPYQQVFGNKFAEGLSLLDLVFCEGPNSRNVVVASAKPH
ncbi:MAG: WbqC family protein [Cyclobacteriaceae bacterium]